MGNQSSALDILVNRMKETGTISTSPKSTTTGLSKTEEEERFRKWQAEAEAARAAAEARNAWENQSWLQKAADVAKSVVSGSGKGIMANLAGAEAAIAGEGTVANDTYALIRSMLNRKDGVGAWEAFDAFGNLFIQRGGGVIPGALDKLYNDVGTLAGKAGIKIDTENDVFSKWNSYLKEKKAAAEKAFYDKVGEVNNIYSAGQKYRQEELQKEQTQAQAKYSKSTAAQNIYKYGTMVGTQLPTIAISLAQAFMGNPTGGGATLAGGLAPATTEGILWLNELNSASKLGQLGMLAANSIGSVSMNPQYWASVSMETGSAYNEAIEAGVDPSMASAYALSYGLLSGIIEVGGGDEAASNIENLPKKIRDSLGKGEKGKAAWEYAKSIIGEIGEEEWQEMLANTMKGSVLGQNVPIYSTTDENAIINPRRMGQTAIDTAITTALMGAGERAIVGGAQSLLDSRKYTGSVQPLVEMAKTASEGTNEAQVRAIEEAYKRNGQINIGQARTLYNIIENAQQNPATKAKLETAIVRDNLREVFRQAGMQITDAELDTMANGYAAETSSIPDYVTSMRTAYTLGKSGNFTLEQATKQAGAGASPLQFRHAFELGRGINAAEAETADIRTAEGREKVASRLSSLGESAERAADAYADGQDIARYAAAMEKAVNLYAANGADLKAIYRSKNADIIKDLTPAQVDLAQELGREAGAQLKANAEARAAELKEIQAQAAQIRMANEAKLPEINAALAAAQDQARTLRQDISGTEEGLKLARQAEPGIVNNAEYQAAEARVEQMRKDEEAVQKTIEQLQEDKKKAQAASQGKRKKGTVRYETAKLRTEKGTETFEAADPKKLNRKQKKVVAMVEAVADAVNADFVLLNARSNMGGAYLQGGTIYINVNSAIGEGENARSIAAASLGHELTHYIEQYAPEEYQELKDFVVSEILKKSPAQFDALVRQQLKWEPNLSYEQAVDELVANACQSMLYNSKAVTKLARQNMNLAEKIADFIESFTQKIREAFDEIDFTEKAGVFRPVQAVMDELERIQEIWDRGLETASGNAAYRNTATEGGAQMMAIGYTTDDIPVAIIEENILDGVPEDQWVKTVKSVMKERFSDGIPIAGRLIKVNDISRSEYTGAHDTRGYKATDGTIYEDKLKAAGGLDDIVLASTNYINEDLEHTRKDNFVQFARGDVLMRIGGNDYSAKVIVGFTSGGNMVLYDVVDFVPRKLKMKKQTRGTRTNSGNADILSDGSASTNSVPNPKPDVNRENEQHQTFDSTGAELTEDQEKFFADSKIRDDQGRLKVMYRGGNGDFTVFDRNKSSYSNLYGRGFYFTDSKSHAEQYGKARAFYLNIRNPVQEGTHDITRAQLRKFLQEVGENEDYGLENYGYGATVDSVMKSLRGKDDFGILQDVNATAIGDFVAAVELFNEVNGTSFDGIIAPTETVAFRAEQIKNTDNKTPTSDPDVRFQMISEVEESDKLIAVHNKTMSGLRRMIERGGVPFPSIAIKKAGSGHNHYGPVSIVFGRSRIDPEVNRANRIYGGDAWTPTEPSLDYDVDSDKVYKIRGKIKTLIGPGPYNSLRLSGTLDADEIAKKLKDSGGDIFEALKSNVGLKYAYMRIMGTEPELPTREKPLDGFFEYKNNQLVELFDQLGEERIQKADYSDEEFRQAVADILNALQREELVAKMKERRKNGESTVSIERILNAYDKRPLYSRGDINVGVIQGALREYISDGRKLTQETDRSALEGILRDNTEVEKDPKYRKYIETTFQGVVRGSGIRNDKDIFTPSGNRRSFKQLHVPATLDNIAKIMGQQEETGVGAFGSNLTGVGVKHYRTVEEARADRGRLYDGDYIDEEEFEGPKKALNDRLQELVEAAAKITSRDYAWEQRDSAREILLEAVRDSKTKAAMDRKLRNEAQWINYDPTLTDELWQLAEDTRNMKVPYFEAKLRRVVYPEEALAYIVEDTAEETDADLLKKMRDQGLNVLTYKAGDKEDRLRVLNSVEGAQFQRYDEQLEGQMAFFDVENSNMHPKMRERLAEAERLTEDIKAYFGSIPESMLSTEDIEGMLDFDVLSRDATSGDMLDPGAVVDELLATVSNGGEYRRRQAYRLAERLIQHMNAITEQTYIGGGNTDRVQDKAFAAWYNARHPSLYYPGYQPGDLFAKHANAFKGRDNIQKEKDYLHGLLESGNLMEPELSQARELLDRMNSPQPKEVFYQRWDDTYEDTSEESTGRELAYSRIQSENAILSNTVKELKKTVKGKDATIEKILKKLARAKKADAEKLARQIMREYSSRADLSEVTAAIKAVGDYYLQTPVEKLDEARVKELAREAATLIAQGAEETVETDNGQLREIRGSLEGQKVYIKPEFLGELDSYGGLKSVKNSLFGKRVYLSSEAGEGRISVDQLYEQLHADFGDYYFPEAGADNGPANEGEEIMIIADVLAASDSMTVNPFDAYMGEAVEAIANGIAFRVMNENVLRPLLPAEAEKAFDQLSAVTEENREIRKKLDAATTRGEIIKEELERLQQEGKDTKSELIELRDQVYDLTSALKKADQRYSALQAESEQRIAQVREEGTARVAEVRAKERERAAKEIQGLKDHYKEIQKKARDRREESAGTTKYRKQVQAKAKALYEMLMKNDDKKHVPEVLKRPVAEFLESIDFTSKRQLRGGDETNADREFGARMRALERALSGQQDYIDGTGDVQEDLGGYVDISQENLQFLRDTIGLIDTALKENRDYTINQMSAAELKQLSNFLSNLNTAIRNLNSFMANARFESVREAAGQDIEHMKEMGDVSKRGTGKAAGFLMWENGTPYYVFKRFGKGGESIFDGLAKGWERMAFNVQEIKTFTRDLYTSKEVNEWKKKVHDITLEDGSRVKMTTAQIMELSMLLNREQARKHIEAGGIRIGDIDGLIQARHYHLSLGDIQKITGMLNARQREVAKALQTYMAKKGAQWGNEVSMRRFGYEFYTEGENYYPIKTDATDRPMSDTDAPGNASMFRLLNLSSSKSLNPHANNALVVGNIFDTTADHMSDMAKLNGMGLPILDAIKYFNYKEKIRFSDGTFDTETMQKVMQGAYGNKALSYFRKLMQDINGTTESGDRGDPGFGKLLSNYKIAAVGANLRVALLQPTSYVRATAVLKPQYMVGIVPSRAAYQEAIKYSGTAVWKSLGYYDTDIARGMRGQIQHDDTWKDKVAEASMKAAELGDQLTWSMLWTACKRQAKGENSNLRGQALMDRTADLFREVVYASQVMDSTLTRSEIMRGKTMYSKVNSSFMAEPTLSYNILLDAYSRYQNDVRRLGKPEAWKRNRRTFAKAVAVYTASAAFSAIMESIADAIRDDDDEKYWEKFRQALLGEGNIIKGNLAQDLSLVGKLPYVKNIISTLQGYKSGDMSITAFSTAIDAANIWIETARLNLEFLPDKWKLDKPTKATYYGKMTPWGRVYKALQAVSQLSGVAASNLTRDATAIWNTIMNDRKNEWKIRTYDGNQLSDESAAAWKEYVENTGISKSAYKSIMSQADVNGTTKPTQDELGEYLVDALAAGEITEEQAQALWKSQWNKENSKTFDKWRGKAEPKSSETNTSTTSSGVEAPSAVQDSKVTDYDGFRKAVPVYSEKKEAAYGAKPSGMTLDRYVQLLQKADTNSNDSITQDEMGFMLRDAVKSGEISFEEAEVIWRSQWNGARSKTLQSWAAKHP